jgi:magnesium-transporting ATPase (P-type)
MKEKRPWKRRKLIVSPSFQWGIVLKIVILTSLVTALFTWSVFYLIWKQSLSSGNLSIIQLLYQPGLWVGLGICLLMSLAVSTVVLLKMTHRIAGQLYRFEKALDQLICGERIHPVLTRKDDYFHDFEAELNRLLDREN